MTVPYSFGAATSAIPLSQLDSNFNTPITLGNTAIQLGNTVTTLNNMTLANVTISSGSITIPYANANAVVYTNSSNVATTTSTFAFDGTNLGLGVTPSAFTAGRAMEVAYVGNALWGTGAGDFSMVANVKYNGALQYANSSIGANRFEAANGAYYWYSASGSGKTAGDPITFTQAMTLDSSGNLGIGVTPSAWGSGYAAFQLPNGGAFWAQKTGAPTVITSANAVFTGSAYNYIGSYAATLAIQSGGQHQWYNAPSGTAGNAITFTQAMTLDASGNLLVGNSSKLSGGVDGLDIDTTAETGITFAKSGTVKNYFYLLTDAASFQWQTVSGVVVNVVSSTNGVTLTNGATSWGSLSDERKKDIIEPIQNATEKVSSLRTVIGKYKTEEDGIRRSMLIAQDVQAVLPEAVTENANGDLILQYTDTIPLLVAAIKEQQALIQTLTERITALEGAK